MRKKYKPCPTCGEEMYYLSTQCRKCYSPKTTQSCLICGNKFITSKVLVDSGHGKYCKPACGLIAKRLYMTGNQHAQGNTPWNKGKKGVMPVPWNKGKKGIHLSPQSEFKEGDIPVNKLTVGDITTRQDKSAKPRQWLKTAEPNIWEQYSIYLWKQKHGSLYAGDVVHHVNGDCMDDRIENLIAVSRSDHPKIHNRNGLIILNAEQLEWYRDRYRIVSRKNLEHDWFNKEALAAKRLKDSQPDLFNFGD